MPSTKTFPFERAKRVTAREVNAGRKAIAKATGRPRAKRVGRPPKKATDKYVPISIRLHPVALKWLKAEAKRRALPYQTIVNEVVLRSASGG